MIAKEVTGIWLPHLSTHIISKKISNFILSTIKVKQIIENVLEIPPGSMNIKTRERKIVQGRQFFYYIMKHKTKKSLAKIGMEFNQDHATVLHGVKTIQNLIDTYPVFNNALKKMLNKLNY